jgi:hypothetical protein
MIQSATRSQYQMPTGSPHLALENSGVLGISHE